MSLEELESQWLWLLGRTEELIKKIQQEHEKSLWENEGTDVTTIRMSPPVYELLMVTLKYAYEKQKEEYETDKVLYLAEHPSLMEKKRGRRKGRRDGKENEE